MKVAVIGATGVLGSAAVKALVADGHDVLGFARSMDKARTVHRLGATAVRGDLFDHDSLVAAFHGCDVVCNLATRIPVGLRALRSAAWHQNDRILTEGVRRVMEAARQAHVRRVVQESVSLLYADHGDEWIDEHSALDITSATEPACVAESHVQDYQSDLRQGVVLRLGMVVGEDAATRFWLRSARNGLPVGLGSPDGWVHPLHTDDLGSAILAALSAPSGLYNVGAEPVRRRELVQGYAEAVGRESGGFVVPVLRRLSGRRVEPVTRSLRVSSERFRSATGWSPRRSRFDVSWLHGLEPRTKVCG